ncbi:MAG: hypothetical protein Q8M98_11630 [Candidatus Cloacimonadaceae bacterium]|nr:hypothetical protein [Candidatus Cloacimonadaceae bacterium]
MPIELSTKFINLGLVILLNFLPGDKLRIYAIFVTMVHLLNPVLYVLYCFRKYYQEVKWKFQKEFGVYRGMIRFSGWIMFGAAASAGEHQGSALIINRFFGTTMNASFGVANQVGSMARMFTHGLSHAVVPQITKSHSAGDHPRSEQLVMLASKYSFFLLLIPALPILLETNYILGVWLTIVPPYTSIFIQMMLIKELIQSSKAGLPALIQASGNIKWFQIITSATSLMVLPISFIAFMLNKPPYFISLIFTITSFVTFVTTLILMRVILDYDVPLYLKRCFSRMLVVTLCMLPLLAINKLLVSGASRFFITLVASEIWLVFMVYLIGMERDERTGMRKYLLSISQTIKIRIGVGNR